MVKRLWYKMPALKKNNNKNKNRKKTKTAQTKNNKK
jgi:hypothetical protein